MNDSLDSEEDLWLIYMERLQSLKRANTEDRFPTPRWIIPTFDELCFDIHSHT